jgi:hypothetical protein
MKLYRSAVHEGQWLACGREIGWVVFPAQENGWEARRPARGIDPVHLREVPLRLAANAGMPQPMHMPVQSWRPKRAA